MEEEYQLECLAEHHLRLRSLFSSGEEALDRYVRERARKEVEQRLAAVWILHDVRQKRIAGFYTLSSATMQREDLPLDFTRRLAPYELYPATLIGRLAVDLNYRGRRLGERLLSYALIHALAGSRTIASVAVIVGAKNEDVQRFYERYNFSVLRDEDYPRRMYLPMKTIERVVGEEAPGQHT